LREFSSPSGGRNCLRGLDAERAPPPAERNKEKRSLEKEKLAQEGSPTNPVEGEKLTQEMPPKKMGPGRGKNRSVGAIAPPQ